MSMDMIKKDTEIGKRLMLLCLLAALPVERHLYPPRPLRGI